MPTNTFFKLKEEKRRKVELALKKEFERVPLVEMSVKNVVEDAQIARGSFYQYFVNREDAIDYIIEGEFQRERSKFFSILNKQRDVLEACYEYLDSNLDDTILKPKYYIHILEYIKGAKTFPIKSLDLDNILSKIDLEKTNFTKVEELKTAISMLMVMTNVTKLTILNECITKELGMKEYRIQLEILKNGILKR